MKGEELTYGDLKNLVGKFIECDSNLLLADGTGVKSWHDSIRCFKFLRFGNFLTNKNQTLTRFGSKIADVIEDGLKDHTVYLVGNINNIDYKKYTIIRLLKNENTIHLLLKEVRDDVRRVYRITEKV